MVSPSTPDQTQILGIKFFSGTVEEAVERMSGGGLLVVPAAPALKELEHNVQYREALLGADLAITDSAFMVLTWNVLQGDSLRRLSGLKYLRYLLETEGMRRPGNCVWIMAGVQSSKRNLEYLGQEGIEIPEECVYLAPRYGAQIVDTELLTLLERVRPEHVVVTLGGGTQERLGLYLKKNLSYLPAIHCIGAAIAFLSGDQVHIPNWADRLYLGWLVRSVSNPKLYVPRYWDARKLFDLIRRYRHRLPVLAK